MKATIIETKKQFEPIEIKLVIESEEELCDLWHRTNISSRKINEMEDYDTSQLKHGVIASCTFWDTLEELVEKHNLTK